MPLEALKFAQTMFQSVCISPTKKRSTQKLTKTLNFNDLADYCFDEIPEEQSVHTEQKLLESMGGSKQDVFGSGFAGASFRGPPMMTDLNQKIEKEEI
jgi:hypothetical protein